MKKTINVSFLTYLVIMTILTALSALVMPATDKGQVNAVALTSNNTGFIYTEPMSQLKDARTPLYFMYSIEKMLESTSSTIPPNTSVTTESVDISVDTNTTIATEVVDRYVVLPYFLNVREFGNADSRIIGVLEKGQIVDLVSDTMNLWVELKSGGFINSSHVRVMDTLLDAPTPIKPAIKQEVKVSQTSAKSKASGEVRIQSMNIVSPAVEGISTKSNLTIEDLEKMLAGTGLEGIEKAVLQVEDEYKINALFTIAVARLESAHGTSKIAEVKNNLFGLNAVDGDAFNKAFSYKTKSDSVLAFGEIIKTRYIEKGYDTLSQINKKYSTSSEWKTKVTSLISRDVGKLKNENYF